MQTVEKAEYPALKRLGAQIGYGIAVGISLVLIYMVANVEEWGRLSFLTEEFGSVAPWIIFSLVVGALTYLAYIRYDSQAIRWSGEIVTNLITIVVTWKVFTVFPFDFTAYDFPWDVLIRFVMVAAILGASAGVVANTVKLVRSAQA